MSEKETKEIIDKIKQEEFPYALAIAKAYEKLQQENEKLKKYCCKRNDCGGRLKQNHKLTDSEVLTEFEKWLEEELKIIYRDCGHKHNVLQEVMDKLQELKKGDKE